MQHKARGQSLLARWQKLPGLLRTPLVLVAYFLGAYFCDQIALAFGTGVYGASLWFPTPALSIVLLLVGGMRYLPALFLAPYAAELLDRVNPFDTLGFGFTWVLFFYSLAKVVGYGGVCWLLKRLRFDMRLLRTHDTAYFLLFASCLAPVVVALLTITVFAVATGAPFVLSDFIYSVVSFWVGDATGIAFLAPSLLVLLRGFLPQPTPLPTFPPLTKRLVLERVCQFALLIFTIWLGYARSSEGFLNYTYTIFLPLMWLGVRGSFELMSGTALLLNILVALAVNYKLSSPEVVALQFNLMTASYASLLLGAVSSDLRYKREKLNHVAYHDALTGLPNRASFLRVLGGSQGKSYAVFFLDLDRFKTINDSFGQTVGDAFLLLVARKLTGILPKEATLARLGADEFGVFLPELQPRDGRVTYVQSTTLEERATSLAREMNEVLAVSNRIQGYDIATDASIGIALSHPGEEDDVLRHAESAMHEAKHQGKARYVLFDAVMRQGLEYKVQLERDLRQALERREIFVYYQPIVSALTGEIVGAEALMRWQHGQLGFIAPAAFIPIAEETGLIVDLSYALLQQTLADLRRLPRSFYLSVNLSVRQLQHPSLVKTVSDYLKLASLEPHRLILEVTESNLMTNPEANIRTLELLSSFGIRLAMDDFGTGYASLNYLKRLPVDILKIDRSFISGLPDDDDDATLVTTILALGQSLGLELVAEGVETRAQEAFLKRCGCDFVQGYLYSKPVPLSEFVGLLEKVKSKESL